jgi:hypothetical protein
LGSQLSCTNRLHKSGQLPILCSHKLPVVKQTTRVMPSVWHDNMCKHVIVIACRWVSVTAWAQLNTLLSKLLTVHLKHLVHRLAISEAAFNASLPGASFSNITTALDGYYRMVVYAYPNATEYQKIYWSMNGYVPPVANTSVPSSVQPVPEYLTKGGGYVWKAGYTAGVLPMCSVAAFHSSVSAILRGFCLAARFTEGMPCTGCHHSFNGPLPVCTWSAHRSDHMPSIARST